MSENILNSENVLTETERSLRARASLYTIEQLLSAQPKEERVVDGKRQDESSLAICKSDDIEMLSIIVSLKRIHNSEGARNVLGQIAVERIAADTLEVTGVNYLFLSRSIHESRGLVALRTTKNGLRSRQMRDDEYAASLLELGHFEEVAEQTAHIANR